MPLRSPSRLPRRLNRPTSRYTRSLVTRRHKTRRVRERNALKGYMMRRTTRWMRIVREELLLWGGILVGLLIVLGFSVLLFSSVFDVKQLTVRRQDARIDVGEVERTLRPLFEERLFLVTKAEVTSLLTDKFPDITSVDIEKTYPSTLTVTIHFDRIVAALDISNPENNVAGTGAFIGSGAYVYITSQGRVVESPIRLTDAPLQVFSIVDWGIRPTHGGKIMDETFILRMFEAKQSLEDHFGLPVTVVQVFLRAREFHMMTDRGIAIWFDVATPLQDHFDRFRRFLETVSLDQAKEYVDLRLTDRVVFK